MTATATNVRAATRSPTLTDPVPVALIARGGAMDGAARQLAYLLRHFDRDRFTPAVFLDRDGPLADVVRGLGIAACITRMRPWRSFRGLPFRAFDLAALIRGCRACGARLVHCSDPWRGPYATRVARALNVPLVMHVRGPTTRRALQKNGCLGADAIIGIAHRYRADVEIAGFDPAAIAICDDAVDGDAYFPDPTGRTAFRSGLAASATDLLVGLVGRVEPFKRVREFVDVIAALPRGLPVHVVIVGDLRRRRYVADVRRHIERLGLAGRITLAGRRDDMRATLSGLDVLVTLSGGSVMFEAMACGTPVLSVRADGRHSQHTTHDGTAWCVTTNGAHVAALALEGLLANEPVRRRLADAGRERVLARLSPATMARRTQDVYEGVLASRLAASSRLLSGLPRSSVRA